MPETNVEVEPTSTVIAIPADPATFDRSGLESRVSAKMADVFANDDDKVAEETPASEAVETPAETEEQPAAEEVAAEEKTKTEDEQAAEEAAGKDGQAKPTPVEPNPESPVVPDAYRRSLKAYQWSDEEIERASKQDHAGFLRMAEKVHATRNEETRRMSELGRQLKAQEASQAATRTKQPETPTEFKPIDVEGLKKKYGADEPFIQQLEQMNGIVTWANQAMPWIQESQKRQAATELESLGRRIDDFFGSKDMEPYHDQYGKAAAKLTDQQATTRQKVLETADLLISGARATGRTMPLDEALTLAHDSVSGPIREKAVRTKIVTAAKARQSAISLRPGARAAAPSADPRKALEAKVKDKLAKAFTTK